MSAKLIEDVDGGRRLVTPIIKGSLEDTSELRRLEKGCDWKGEGSRGDVN